MRLARWRLLLATLAVLAALILLAPWIGSRAPLPIVDTVEVLGDEIYLAIDRAKRLPVEVALPHIARAGGSQFVKRLPLDDAVRSRLLARLDSRGFVDEIVPFLLAVKNMYLAPDEARTSDFDTHLRASVGPRDNLPGIEHSMFSWVREASGDATSGVAGFGLDPELAAELLEFYDVLYLEGRDPTAGLDQRLACEPAEIEDRLAAAAARSGPALRRLLQRVRDGMEAGSELAGAVDRVLEDEVMFETISISVVHFVELMVCKHYRMFTSRVARQRQLEGWLLAELDRAEAGRMWSYLERAQHERRYGVLIVVDGLQGHLIEALARGDAANPFIRQILEEQNEGMLRLKSTTSSVHDLQQQTRFLNHLANRGFTHPAYLPFFRDLYTDGGEADALQPWGIAVSGVSTTPTISVRNLPIVQTGAPVAGAGATGIPNFHFVDRNYERNGVRQGRAYYFFGNDALQLTTLTTNTGMQSLFQRLPARSSYSCSAQYDNWAQAGIDPFFNLALGEAVRDFGEVLCFSDLERRVRNEQRLRGLRDELLGLRDRLGVPVAFYDWYHAWGARTARARAQRLIRRIAELEEDALPELWVYYNPWPDHFAHFTGPSATKFSLLRASWHAWIIGWASCPSCTSKPV